MFKVDVLKMVFLLLTLACAGQAQLVDHVSEMEPMDVKRLCAPLYPYHSMYDLTDREIKAATAKYLSDQKKWKVVFFIERPTTQDFTYKEARICYVSGPIGKVTLEMQFVNEALPQKP